MSEIRVKSTGTIKLFESDNTSHVTIASPSSLSANRTITIPDADVTLGAGVSLTGSTNNQVTTVTGANAITGETNFIYNGTIVGAGADGANADLGTGVHIKSGDSGQGSVEAEANLLILESASGGGLSIYTGNSHEAKINFGDSGNDNQGQIMYHHNGDSMRFNTNNDERMRIDSAGNVMVGVTSSGNSGKDTFTIQRNSTGLGLYIRIADSSSTYNGMQVRVDRDSAGEYNYVVYENNGGTEARIQDNGNMFNTNNSYGALSDERIKENLTDANSQWNDIKALKIKNYKYKDKSKAPTQLGVIAQDLETANMSGLIEEFKPDVSHIKINSDFGTLEDDLEKPILDENKNETGEYEQKVKTVNSKVKSVKYSVLYMKAIKALQESMERIEQLEAKVTALENA